MSRSLAMKLEETAKFLSNTVNSSFSDLAPVFRRRAEDLIAPLDRLAEDIWRSYEHCGSCGGALDRDGDCLSCGEAREDMDDLRVVCRDCDMTLGEFRERFAEIRRTNPDYTEADFWCDHELDSCPGSD